MNAVGSWQVAVGGKGSAAFAFLLFTFYLCFAACSIPNLEPQSCIDSRTAIREFYSFHFGNDMHLSPESLSARKRFLTEVLAHRISEETEGTDPFTTRNGDVPRAFRVGKCTEVASDKVEYQVLLFWRDDNRTEQREIKVDLAKQNERWLVDNVTK